MTSSANAGLEDLIHDVNSKCASLKNAAVLLRKVGPHEERELLSLMAQQARTLAETIVAYAQRKMRP